MSHAWVSRSLGNAREGSGTMPASSSAFFDVGKVAIIFSSGIYDSVSDASFSSALDCMAQISLIVLESGSVPGSSSIDAVVDELSHSGHAVEVKQVQPTVASMSADPPAGRIQPEVAGLAAAAVAGLNASSGEILVVLDPSYGYTPGDVSNVIYPLLRGSADLVVGSRYARPVGGLRSMVGVAARLLGGTSDPFSGLVAITGTAFTQARAGFLALGQSFALELVTRVPGRQVEMPIHSVPAWRRLTLGWDDIRHLKRLADHRYGTWSRLVQFCTCLLYTSPSPRDS